MLSPALRKRNSLYKKYITSLEHRTRSILLDEVQAENRVYDEAVGEIACKTVAFLMRTVSSNSVDREFRASPSA